MEIGHHAADADGRAGGVTLVVGDCRATLARWAAEGVRVQCVVTSPPYWGLRDYGTAPLVWGGEAGCAHEWGGSLGERTSSPQQSRNGQSGVLGPRDLHPSAQRTAFVAAMGHECHRCGAWRGHLGLEPTPEFYVAHLVEVFRLVRDVLADDGTCWLNLGDSYASSRRPGACANEVEGGWRVEHAEWRA